MNEAAKSGGLSGEEKGELEEMVKHFSSQKYCLHPQAPTECSPEIIKAHSVPESWLDLIANTGNLYSFSYPVNASIQKQDIYIPRQRGKGKASVFTGFCRFHDNKLFEPIENHPFQVTPQHIFLVAYRSLCFTLFKQRSMIDDSPNLQKFFHEDEEELARLFVSLYIALFVLDIFDHMKQAYDHALLTSDYSSMHYYALEIKGTPDFLCAETILPAFDFHGNQVQDVALTNPDREYINFAVTGNGHIVFSWIGESAAGNRLIESIKALSDEEKINAITRFAFVHVKNLFFAPGWWDGMDANARQDLAEKQVGMMFKADMSLEEIRSHLLDKGSAYTNMQITGIQTNV